MKIYIHTDIEGVAGYVFHEDRLVGEQAKLDHVYRMRSLFTGEVNAAVDALAECGVEDIVINDSHANCYNLFFEDINPVAQIIHGPGTRMPMWLPCIDRTFSAMICIGQHDMAGTNGVLPHSRWDIKFGDNKGISLGETGAAMLIAGHFDIPTIMVSGDNTVCKQIKDIVPQIETAVVKEALSPYNAKTVVPKKAHEMIRSGVKMAVKRIKEIQPYKLPPPYSTTLVASTPGFESTKQEFKADNIYSLFYETLCSAYDYELYNETQWPLVPRGEFILNKHERAYKKALEEKGQKYIPYIVSERKVGRLINLSGTVPFYG